MRSLRLAHNIALRHASAEIMQKSKVQHHHYDLPKDLKEFENKPDFDEISYLVRYLVDDQGNKQTEDKY